MRTRFGPWPTAPLIAAGLTVALPGTATAAPPAPVPRLELDRYLGQWLSGFVPSRTPALDEGTWQRIDEAVRIAGQDPCVYLTSPTTDGREGVTPLCAR